MKKVLSLVLVVAMTAALLAGCSGKPAETTAAPTTAAPTTAAPATTEAPATQAPAAEGALKTGYAIVGGLSSNTADAGEKDGLAQSDFTAVAVLVDENGVIVDCKIDVAQNKLNFSADGKLLTAVGTEILSKQELKEDYNMKPASPIGKEWYEQADAFAEYVIGKTADEVSGIAVDEKTHPTDADITAGCTMSVGDMVEAIATAVKGAESLGAQSGDKLGLGLVTNVAYQSKDADEKDGLAQADTTYAVVSADANGKITSCIIDVTQAKVTFDAQGKVTSDLTTAVITKAAQKDDYNMKPASPIGKEWYEQAEAFEAYVTGKTAAEVTGIATDDAGHPTDADLTAGCTMAIGDFTAAVAKAVADAQ